MRKVLKSQEDIKQVTEPHMVTGTMEEIAFLLMQVAHSLVVAEQEHMEGMLHLDSLAEEVVVVDTLVEM